MTDKNNQQQEFAKGIKADKVETKYGDIIKLGINLEAFCENEVNDRGYINLEIKTSKNGRLYVVVQENSKK